MLPTKGSAIACRKISSYLVDELAVFAGKTQTAVFLKTFDALAAFDDISQTFLKNISDGDMNKNTWQNIAKLSEMQS